ncbi:hypothetical protein Bca52824_014935 [Brassica carinata]|uniref:diacylglycerol O-acyltransferase n=1 Tax=Brassica carinata TaxID=52824 RepID=A0A8X7W2D5_BRACI|nr:hypothetical protein Bca52824_014935 [Brassica carinata]
MRVGNQNEGEREESPVKVAVFFQKGVQNAVFWFMNRVMPNWVWGDPLYVKGNKLSSTKTQLPYHYYYLNYCKPSKIVNNAENLGEVLRGDRIENSVYTMSITKQVTEGEEPVSPFAQLFSLPGLDVFNIVTIGCKTEGDASTIIEGLKNTLINHPRFSSILVTGHGEGKEKARWIPTIVKVEDHVIVPDIDPYIENPDEFLENYTSNMALSPMDMSKPLWEFHLLKLKTSHAESVAVARFHHSLGDGMSLMSLLLACTRKICDPEALPTFMAPKKSKAKNACWSLVAWLWFLVKTMFHTCVEVSKALAFTCFLGDTTTYLSGKPGVTLSPNKFIHQIIPLDDVKNVKNAMNITVNDVLFRMVQAGLSRYLNQRYGK